LFLSKFPTWALVNDGTAKIKRIAKNSVLVFMSEKIRI